MGQGFAGIRRASEDINARRSGGGDGQPGRLVLGDKEHTRVRFLEAGDDVKWAWMHSMPPKNGKQWGEFTPCRDQGQDGSEACPACASPVKEISKRSFRGYVNVIRRDAPTFQKDNEGNIVKDAAGNWVKAEQVEEQLQYWEGGITVFEELDTIDRTFKGLDSRDFIITRRGTGLNTRYSIVPADPDAGSVPMTQKDMELAGKKRDLNLKITPVALDEMIRMLGGGNSGSAMVDDVGRANPFRARRED